MPCQKSWPRIKSRRGQLTHPDQALLYGLFCRITDSPDLPMHCYLGALGYWTPQPRSPEKSKSSRKRALFFLNGVYRKYDFGRPLLYSLESTGVNKRVRVTMLLQSTTSCRLDPLDTPMQSRSLHITCILIHTVLQSVKRLTAPQALRKKYAGNPDLMQLTDGALQALALRTASDQQSPMQGVRDVPLYGCQAYVKA